MLRSREARILRAFAEALAPGLGDLPRAAGDAVAAADPDRVDVVARLEGYLAAVQPGTLRRMRLALWALELMPFPWRFSRASPEARHEFLRSAETDGSPLARDVILFVKVLAGLGYASDERVARSVGYEAGCVVAAGHEAPASSPRPLGDLAPPHGGEECDVVIVGSGAGGAAAASMLAEAGLEVVVLEAGPYLDRTSYPVEPLAALTSLYRDGGLTVCDGRPAIPTPVGRAVGGTTVINSGTCFRTPEPILERWRTEFGIDWATELDPDYDAAEELLAVTPVDPETMGRNGQLLREGAEALGVAHEPLRRNAGRCVRCSSCPFGCRLDAKRAVHVSYLPRAVGAGARVRAGIEATEVTFDRGRAVGVECVTKPEEGPPLPVSVRARRAVVLAGGAFGTPELLLRSGFSSPSGELGKNLRIHPACWVGARFDEEVRGWDGVMQSYAVTEWEEEHGVLLEATFTPLAFGAQWLPGFGTEHQQRVLAYDHIASTGVHLSDTSTGRVSLSRRGRLRTSYRLNRRDADALTFGVARAAELLYAAGAREVYPQISGISTLRRERIPDLEAAPPPRSHLRLEAFHPMGTARMGADSRWAVVGTDGAVHGVDGLYVADGSLMPSSLGVNPMMTIIAMASRVARQMADALV
jgi:choline dehydrogenase-like flavoprotein